MKLSELAVGKTAEVRSIDTEDSIRRRLQDMGLVSGTDIVCLYNSPLRDPKAFLIRGAVIALRSEDSGRITIHSKR